MRRPCPPTLAPGDPTCRAPGSRQVLGQLKGRWPGQLLSCHTSRPGCRLPSTRPPTPAAPLHRCTGSRSSEPPGLRALGVTVGKGGAGPGAAASESAGEEVGASVAFPGHVSRRSPRCCRPGARPAGAGGAGGAACRGPAFRRLVGGHPLPARKGLAALAALGKQGHQPGSGEE